MPTAELESREDDVALEVRNLSKTFPGTVALSDVSVRLLRGEVHALVGHNGSGKSTFIKILAGFHTADPGAAAAVRGIAMQIGDSTAARQAGLRFVHQDLGLVGSLDSVDNLALGSGYLTGFGSRIRWRRQREAALAEIAALGHSFDVGRPVDELSAVERTTLALARVLRDFDGVAVLALDEPTAAMPRADVDRLHQIVRRVCDSGVAVLYVSHHLDEVVALADRVTILRDGSLVATHPVSEVDSARLVELMTGSVAGTRTASQPKDDERRPVVMELRGLSGEHVRELDLSLHEGEIVGIAGLDGSGRDEVCACVFGGRARTGHVTVTGQMLPAQRPDLAVAAGVGFAPADRTVSGVVLPMTVKENLTLADLRAYRRGVHLSGRRERQDAEKWTSRLRVRAASLDTELTALSGGNQQKVVLGKWLRLKPKVLLLDEPTQGIDVAAKVELHSQIDETARSGAAVLVCSSDEDELAQLCDRVVVLRNGRVAAEFCRPHIDASAIASECLSATPQREVP